MHVYLGVYSVLAIAGLSLSGRSQKTFVLFAALFLLWFMGARYWVGCDFYGYLMRFNQTDENVSIGELVQHFEEPGFWLLTSLVKSYGLSYMWLNVFASAIMLICFVLFARSHRDSGMVMALLFPVIIVQLGMSGIRQGLATGFLMVASLAWMRGNKIWTALWILLGAQFHASVIMFLPLALLAGRRISTIRMIAAVLIIGPIAVFLIGDRFETYSSRYIGTDISSGGALIRYVLILIPALGFSLYWRRLAANFPEVFDLLKLFSIISYSLMPVAIFSSILLHRMNYYIMPFSILTFVYVSRVALRSNDRVFVRSIPAVLYGGYSFFWFLSSTHADRCYIPYQTFAAQPAF